MIKQQTQIMYDININMLSDELFDAINIIEEAMTQYPYHKHYESELLLALHLLRAVMRRLDNPHSRSWL